MITEILAPFKIILASQSPRRHELIKGLGIDFKIQLKQIEEIYSDDLKREEITNYLAKLKASSFDKLKENEIVITSDTIVWFDEKPLEKPKDKNQAIEMLTKLSGEKHEVLTSICLTTSKKQIVDFDVTSVFFKELSGNEIDFYVENFKPYDKAGSYGIQEWIGYIGVEKIEGSYSNVMGLPTHLLYKMLNDFV